MGRSPRLDYSGAIHHVTTRGVHQSAIYRADRDRHLWLDILADVCMRHQLRVYAYCQMGNHYHLLLETREVPLAHAIHDLNGRYARKFNARHAYKGHLFESRYVDVLVGRDAHLLELCRYLVLNPVRAGMVRKASEWPWSSYHATRDPGQCPAWLDTGYVRDLFDVAASQSAYVYETFVAEGCPSTATDYGVRHPSGWDHTRVSGTAGGARGAARGA